MCPICSEEIFSGLALIHHLKYFHKGVKPHKCELCDSAFNNLKDKSSHTANVHGLCDVHCIYCDHTTTTKSKMHQHMHKHMKGFCCKTCQCSFQNERLLLVHRKLHQKQQHYDCDQCDNFYFTEASLCLHKKGKHGSGYPCPCGQVFATPN